MPWGSNVCLTRADAFLVDGNRETGDVDFLAYTFAYTERNDGISTVPARRNWIEVDGVKVAALRCACAYALSIIDILYVHIFIDNICDLCVRVCVYIKRSINSVYDYHYRFMYI